MYPEVEMLDHTMILFFHLLRRATVFTKVIGFFLLTVNMGSVSSHLSFSVFLADRRHLNWSEVISDCRF